MTTCTIETGLFRKKPYGNVSVAHCLNCEQPLCAQDAVAEVSEAGSRTGHFMCTAPAGQQQKPDVLEFTPKDRKPG